MTTPQKITPQSQPQFPCWLWSCRTEGEIKPQWYRYSREEWDEVSCLYHTNMYPFTHWHPDQPHAPAPVDEEKATPLTDAVWRKTESQDWKESFATMHDHAESLEKQLPKAEPLSAATGESTEYHGSAAHQAVRRRDEQVHGMLIGGWHLCQHGHGVVKNSEQCPQCALEATLNPDQKAAMLKAWAQEQVRKSNEHFQQLHQVFSERPTEQPRRPVQGNVSGGNQNPTSADAGMDAGTAGDKKALAPTPPPGTATDAAATPRTDAENKDLLAQNAAPIAVKALENANVFIENGPPVEPDTHRLTYRQAEEAMKAYYEHVAAHNTHRDTLLNQINEALRLCAEAGVKTT